MLQGFFSCQSSFRLANQLFDEIFCISRDIIPLLSIKVKFSFLDHPQYLLVIISIEGGISTEQDIEDAPSWPQVTAFIVTSSEYFRRYIVRLKVLFIVFTVPAFVFILCSPCLARNYALILTSSIQDFRQSEVNNLYIWTVVPCFKQEVFGFQIPVANVLGVAVVNCL